MGLILGFSTSTPHGSVAIVGLDGPRAEATHEVLAAHAERVFGLVEEVFTRAGARRESIVAVACDVGPGSFTGVRVGVASAAGVAAALGVPGIGVGSLASMAHAALARAPRREAVTRIVALIDAKKDEIYVGVFDGSLAPLEPAKHVSRADASRELARLVEDPGTLVAGSVAAELCTQLDGERHPRGPGIDLPSAASIAMVARAFLSSGTSAPLEPVYVREPDAKPSW
jgi:tRNA threonylcarbamoyladenosine biosynthesis protein TsaB